MKQEKDISRIAVVGSPQSGKSALTERLQSLIDAAEMRLQLTEIHNLDDLHAHSFAVILQVVDCMHLEQSLMLTPHIIDEHEKIVMAFNRYDLLQQTDHSLDIQQMRMLIGVPLELVSVETGLGLDSVIHLLEETVHKPLSTAHPIYHLRDLNDDDADGTACEKGDSLYDGDTLRWRYSHSGVHAGYRFRLHALHLALLPLHCYYCDPAPRGRERLGMVHRLPLAHTGMGGSVLGEPCRLFVLKTRKNLHISKKSSTFAGVLGF